MKPFVSYPLFVYYIYRSQDIILILLIIGRAGHPIVFPERYLNNRAIHH